MTWELALDIILDALKDSALVFAFVFLVHIIISFIENSFSKYLVKNRHMGPLFGSLFGLIPQCGTSVLGADLYIKKYITIGSLIAIFLSCSDEALIAILASANPEKMIMVLPLIGLKFVIGFIIGFLVDLIFRKQELHAMDQYEGHTCHLHDGNNGPFHKHFGHPLIHSIEIFVYVLIINLILGFVIGFVGEDNFMSFIQSNRYLSPLFASIIGLIPNCASSLLLSELFIENSLSFGALLSGLLVNAGLGMMVLFKSKRSAKSIIIIILVCFAVAVIAGYTCCLILGF